MSVGQFAASLLLGLLAILLPLLAFILMVAVCACAARWWIDRKS